MSDDDGQVARPADDSFNTSEYQALRVLFRDESQEALDQVTRMLLRVPAQPMDTAALNEILRATHSLKGTAGTVGLSAFADAAHRFEGVVEKLRAGVLPWTADTRDSLVEIIDWLRARAALGEDEGEEAAALGAQLDGKLAALSGDPASRVRAATEPTPGEPVSAAYRLARRDERTLLRVDPSRIDRLMDSVGELVFDRTRIERRVTELGAAVAELGRIGAALRAAAVGADALDATARALDGQLVQLERLGRELLDDAGALRRTGNALQDGLTDIRMQSSRTLFQRLAPQVRALARAAGKSVKLVTLGGETEFDKSVADQIGDALIHLLRNAVAHGIEPRELRTRLRQAGGGSDHRVGPPRGRRPSSSRWPTTGPASIHRSCAGGWSTAAAGRRRRRAWPTTARCCARCSTPACRRATRWTSWPDAASGWTRCG